MKHVKTVSVAKAWCLVELPDLNLPQPLNCFVTFAKAIEAAITNLIACIG